MIRPKRKAIPLAVRVTVGDRQKWRCAACGEGLNPLCIEFDHRPAIISRPVNAAGTDYDPPQNHPDFIEALDPSCHQQRTTGRKPGAERTVTTKGSDVWLKSKFNRLEGRTKKRPKQKIQSRGFQKRKPSVDKR